MSRQSELAELSRVYDSSALSNRNMVTNGDIRIDQRNGGASVTQTVAAVYTLDRWQMFGDVTSKFSVQQNAGSVTPPAGFTNYLGVTSLSAYTLGTNERFFVRHKIEGYNISKLAFGTANAKSITLSFWVRSSLTGTFGGSIQNSAGNRSYPFTFTISAATTWEYKTITVAGDTTGTWLTTNGIGLVVNFGLGVQGSTYAGTAGAWNSNNNYSATGGNSVVGTSGATFYLTGVQLEVGDTATPFEHRSYGDELARCQRYYYEISGNNSLVGHGFYYGSSEIDVLVNFPVPMRTSPTLTSSNNTNDFVFQHYTDTFNTWNGIQYYNGDSLNMYVYSGVSGTGGQAGMAKTNTSTGKLQFSSEL